MAKHNQYFKNRNFKAQGPQHEIVQNLKYTTLGKDKVNIS